MPPYSSTTMAMWLRLPRNSLSSTFSRLLSGMKHGWPHASRDIEVRSSACDEVAQQVLGQQDPDHLFAVVADHREIGSGRTRSTMGRSSSGGIVALEHAICDRGTMTSRTWVSRTSRTPSSMASSSASMSPRSLALASKSSELFAVACGSPLSDPPRRRSQRSVGVVFESSSWRHLAGSLAGRYGFGIPEILQAIVQLPGRFHCAAPRAACSWS